MKRFHIVLFLLMNLVSSIMGQVNVWEMRTPPKDSLSDLWIVTVDVSKSMLDFRQGLSSVPDKVESMIASNRVKGKQDVYALQLSGANKEVLLTKNGNSVVYDDKGLMSDLIHKTRFFSSLDELIKNLGNTVGNSSSFVYNMSFTSLIRPLSIYELVLEDDMDFGLFRNVYHILVTDDGDINDQWMQDYKWMRKWAPKHFSQFNEIISHVACSEFDFTSRKAGKFVEITSSVQQPRIYLTEYVTYQNNIPDTLLPADSLVEVCDFHDDHLVFQMQPCDSSIGFVYLRNCFVNGDTIEVNQYLYPGNQLLVTFDTVCMNIFGNNVSIEGTYQEHYDDRVLGWRFRTVGFNGNLAGTFVSAETKAAGWKYLKVVVALVLAILLFIIVWRNLVVLRIYVNGKCWSIQQKAMKKLRNDDYNVVTVQCDPEARETSFWFLLGKGFPTEPEHPRRMGKKLSSWHQEHNGNELRIKSNRKLGHISTEMVYDEDRNGFRFDFDESNIGDEIHFSYSTRLSHNLIIEFIGRRKDEPVKWSDNLLRDYNLNMLAVYARNAFDVFEFPYKMVPKEKNHVQVNIIRKEVLGSTFNEDYAVLNIFDHNSCNSANRIFLRYSLACFFDHNQTTEQTVADRLIEVARYVLKSEHQKASYIESKPYMKYDFEEQGLDVDVSPLLSYLYLLKKGQSRLVYSPFKDGCQPLSDGRQGLVRKTIKVFPNFSTTLLNLPFKYRHPEMKVNGPTKVAFEKCFHEAECMDFLGDDRIRFLGVEKDWTMGVAVGSVNGSTHRSWPLDVIIEDANKQK